MGGLALYSAADALFAIFALGWRVNARRAERAPHPVAPTFWLIAAAVSTIIVTGATGVAAGWVLWLAVKVLRDSLIGLLGLFLLPVALGAVAVAASMATWAVSAVGGLAQGDGNVRWELAVAGGFAFLAASFVASVVTAFVPVAVAGLAAVMVIVPFVPTAWRPQWAEEAPRR